MIISLMKLKNALEAVEGEGWDGKTINYVLDAISRLKELNASLENVTVKGRDNIDALLGCMMGIDMIIGEEGGNG